MFFDGASPALDGGIRRLGWLMLLASIATVAMASPQDKRQPRARDLGIAPGILAPGELNAITDVPGVRVGHQTLIKGDNIRTGVTVIVPHSGNLFQDKVPAGVVVGNGFGKFMGSAQVQELGELETPIALTNTLAVSAAAAGLVDWTLKQPGNEKVRSVNAVVGETNDGDLNDIRARVVQPSDVAAALSAAQSGPVSEGNVGAGTGTHAFAWKGGIGTSSRMLPANLGGYTVGVLVQTNYGGVLTVMGAPVGRELGQYYLRDELSKSKADGSVIIVVATDAPLSDRNLERVARRTFLGIGRTGSAMTNGSGDFAIAFSVAESVRRTPERRQATSSVADVPNDAVSPIFQATVEATEEAVYNAMLAAQTMESNGARAEKLPIDQLQRILRRYGIAPR